MTEAERLRVRSIAIPPICVGILGYSPSVVAKVLTEEVANYIATNTNSITDVRFVVLKSDKIILQVSDIFTVQDCEMLITLVNFNRSFITKD